MCEFLTANGRSGSWIQKMHLKLREIIHFVNNFSSVCLSMLLFTHLLLSLQPLRPPDVSRVVMGVGDMQFL